MPEPLNREAAAEVAEHAEQKLAGGQHKVTAEARFAVSTQLSAERNPERRNILLATLSASGQKLNTLAAGLTPDEMEELKELTRQEYLAMESAVSTLTRLDAALMKHFDSKDAKELQDLARHTMGLYLNTHQYHNAVHALSMTREALHLAEIAGIHDEQSLKTLVIQGLYHDAGNGEQPTKPTTKDADETQAVAVFVKDLKEVERRIRAEEDLGELSVLAKLTSVNIHGKDFDQKTVIAACIAATVFRDRFAPTETLALQQYVGGILEHVHSAPNYTFLQIRHLEEMTELMGSGLAWIARGADVVGSTFDMSVLQNNILNRVEDVRRGVGDEVGPAGYHAGFIGFVGAKFFAGPANPAVAAARGGSVLFLPEGEGDAASVIAYGKVQMDEETQRYETLMKEHGSLLTGLYVLIGEAHARGENFLTLPVAEIYARIQELAASPDRVKRAGLILKKEKIDSLDINLENYPLLQESRNAHCTISAMTPGLVNRLFAPNAAQTAEQAWMYDRLAKIEQCTNGREQPILVSMLELANLHAGTLKHESFKNGESIIAKDSQSGRVLVILEGTVTINTGDHTFARGPGAVIGEISALTNKPANADVIAESDVVAASLPAELLCGEYNTEDLRRHILELIKTRKG